MTYGFGNSLWVLYETGRNGSRISRAVLFGNGGLQGGRRKREGKKRRKNVGIFWTMRGREGGKRKGTQKRGKRRSPRSFAPLSISTSPPTQDIVLCFLIRSFSLYSDLRLRYSLSRPISRTSP